MSRKAIKFLMAVALRDEIVKIKVEDVKKFKVERGGAILKIDKLNLMVKLL